MARLQAARRPVTEREPRDHGHFDLLAARYKYLRTFTPAVLAHLPLTGNASSPDVAALLNAVEVLRYVADEELRRRVRRQLNKGESLHALRRDLFFAHQGQVRRRHLDDQVDQALCLTLVTNAAVLWTTTYLGDALEALRADGYPVTEEDAAPRTPAQRDHINFYGTYSFDLETEMRREGHRHSAHRPPDRPPASRRDQICSATEGTPPATELVVPSGRSLGEAPDRCRCTRKFTDGFASSGWMDIGAQGYSATSACRLSVAEVGFLAQERAPREE